MPRPRMLAALLAALLALTTAPAIAVATPPGGPLGHFKHLVIVYEENHSFDNLYGGWGDVNGQHVVGLPDADQAHTTQVSEAGAAYDCLMQDDVNLASPPLSALPGCDPETVAMPVGSPVSFTSHFANGPFRIDDYIAPTDLTCPPLNNLFGFGNGVLKTNPPAGARAGGCTRDLVHKFYQEIYQLDGGKMDRYVTGSDAIGLSMGHYDTSQLPIWRYLHEHGAPNYVIADHFFQAAFGGSYLNHQYLVAAQPIVWNAAPASQHAVLDSNGGVHAYPLYRPTGPVVDGTVTQVCGAASAANGLACGNYSVNTSLPFLQPTAGYGPKLPMVDDLAKPMNIGDEMSDAGVSWAWYSGGWDNAAGIVGGRGWTNGTAAGPNNSCPDPDSVKAGPDGNGQNSGWPYCPNVTFQQHHQPLAYFARYGPGTSGRAQHLKDEQDFLAAASAGTLPQVSFVKPLGIDNEHPGYASEPNGSDHLVDLIQAVESGPEAGNTLILVTYDEFGGQWDHVPPPGLGTGAAAGQADQFGPGTRIPALVIGRSLTTSGVDHTVYDTTSILRTIEAQYGLAPLSTRDAAVRDLGTAISLGRRGH